eukprot:TRINITY_DN5615_c0_g1_i1.p1 TRINITY_DN5615_c0_g1~~TRINITY_DN5615_c0_g1_i1.p1  ORF type:complete len:455 (-),score=74.06 TRINITY_DN5615_c0_g1_i1:2-1366(-)
MEKNNTSSPTLSSIHDSEDSLLTWSSKFSDKSSFLELDPSHLILTYKERVTGKPDNEPASVRSSRPISPTTGIFYWELTILKKGRAVGIGIGNSNATMNKLPGMEKHSFGYHTEDGSLHKGTAALPYGPTCTTGDVIGCCLNFLDNLVFFTKNGLRLGVANKDLLNASLPIYAMVGTRGSGDELLTNFGQGPFVFDYLSYFQEEKAAFYKQLHEKSSIRGDPFVLEMVADYLFQTAHGATAEALALECSGLEFIRQRYQRARPSIEFRQGLKVLVLEGRVDKVVEEVEKRHPRMFERNPKVGFFVQTQVFVELIRSQAPVAETVGFGQSLLLRYFKSESPLSYDYQNVLEEAFALVAYHDPFTSPVAYLLQPFRREFVADLLNSAILEEEGESGVATLESVYRQFTAIREELHAQNCPSLIFTDFKDLLGKPTKECAQEDELVSMETDPPHMVT